MAFGSHHSDNDDAPMSDINVTPLVDVMLVLLIVFMITMPVLTHSIHIDLPISGSQNVQNPKQDIKPIEIGITIDGHYTLGAESSQPLDFSEIQAHLNQVGTDNPDAIIAIDADKNAPYEHVAKLLEAAREAKLSKIGFRMEVQNPSH